MQLWPLAIEYLVVPVVPPGAEPTLAIGRKPNACIYISHSSLLNYFGDINLTY